MRRRYQHALKSPLSAMPLAGVSGENGTVMVCVHGTSRGLLMVPVSSIAKSQDPSSDSHPGRCSCGLGDGASNEARGMCYPEQTAIHRYAEIPETAIRFLLSLSSS